MALPFLLQASLQPREKPPMFTLPSMWNLIISTIVFLIAAKHLHRYLEGQGLPTGMTRGTLVFVLASLASWGSGELVDWSQAKIQGPQVIAQSSDTDELTQLLKLVGQLQPVVAELKESGSN